MAQSAFSQGMLGSKNSLLSKGIKEQGKRAHACKVLSTSKVTMRTRVLLVSSPSSSSALPRTPSDDLTYLNVTLNYSFFLRPGEKNAVLFTWLRNSQPARTVGIWDRSGRKH